MASSKHGLLNLTPLGETDTARTLTTKIVIIFSSVLMTMFVFTQPLLSYFFNDYLGYVGELCNVPAREITCGDGQNYTDIARRFNRTNDKGELIGCQCEQGFFRDWACANQENGFSISYFISTAPGTGAMAAFSWWPCLGMWFHGQGSSSFIASLPKIPGYLLLVSLILFQFFYGLFLINTLCVQRELHYSTTGAFILFATLHFLTLMGCSGIASPRGVTINTLLWFGLLSFYFGQQYEIDETWLGQHCFWIGECFGISVTFLIAPARIIEEWVGLDPLSSRQSVESPHGSEEWIGLDRVSPRHSAGSPRGLLTCLE